MLYDRFIVALDPPRGAGVGWALRVASALCGFAWGFKLGLPFLAGFGVEGFRLVRRACPGASIVADLKLADIGFSMRLTVERVGPYVDAVIAHSFVGVEGGLGELAEWARESGVRLALVYTMSHGGSAEVLAPCRGRLAEVIRRVRPWGVVAPATRPGEVEEARRLFPWARILSPGVGAQGARPGSALCAGADYEIVGRSVAHSPRPLEALLEAAREASRCHPR